MESDMMKVIAVDDEPLALGQLEKCIAKVPFLELAGAFTSALNARKYLEQNDVEAMFVDVNMPDMSGIELVRSLVNPPLLVFTTAYSEYAVEGFKVNAVDYLLKPYTFDEFLTASEKLKKRLEMERASGESSLMNHEAQEKSVFLKAGYKIVKVNASDIVYVESMSEYLKIYEAGESMPKIVLMSFRKLLEKLPPSGFVRVHKSYVVNLSKVVEVSNGTLCMEGGKIIPIGDSYRTALLDLLDLKK